VEAAGSICCIGRHVAGSRSGVSRLSRIQKGEGWRLRYSDQVAVDLGAFVA
jgi:hypothetical protein